MKRKKSYLSPIARRLLTWMHFPDLDEGFEGDIEEDFNERINTQGRKKAMLWLWMHAIVSIPKYMISSTRWRFYMFVNYLKIALRNLKRNKGFSLINIAGLSIGIACCILVFYFIQYEKTYDRFHKNIDRIYYIMGDVDMGRFKIGVSPEPSLSEKIRDEFPEIDNTVRLKKEELLIRTKGDAVKMKGISTDPSFLSIFTFPLALGDTNSALEGLSSIVLTDNAAKILFGRKNPLGETVSINIRDEYVDFIVSGVTQSIPYNSSLQFDFLLNLESIRSEELKNSQISIPTFLLLAKKDMYRQLIEKFPLKLDKELSDKFNGKGTYHLYPLAGYHLDNTNSSLALSDKGNITYIYILTGIAILVLLTACFNYTNLSIGRFSNRIKEAGMRKVLGAQRRQIARQFLFESVVLAVFSLVLAILLSVILLPSFNFLVGKELLLNPFGSALPVMFLFILSICVGCIAGAYPALIAARFSSIELIGGRLKLSGKNLFSRTLIVFQFAASIFLIIGTLFMHKQINFLLSQDLGYSSEKVIRIPLESISTDNKKNQSFYKNYKNKLIGYPSIKNVCGAKYSLSSSWMLWVEKTKDNEVRFIFDQNYIDHDYIDVLGIPLLQGRYFSRDFPSDLTDSVIVNEEFVKEMGIAEPIGKTISEFFHNPSTSIFGNARIIGVVKDFNYQTLSKKIRPIVLLLNREESYDYMYVKFSGSVQETINILQTEYTKLAPYTPFTFSFLDEQVALQYQNEKKWSSIITWASLFAIIIACSGLFGLTLLIVTKRTKEIGIRKVLGASVSHIVRMINTEFIWLVVLSNLIAWPAVYYFTHKFLQNYAYRISIDIWTFITAGMLALLIAILTISIHAVKAGLRNPVEVIKYE